MFTFTFISYLHRLRHTLYIFSVISHSTNDVNRHRVNNNLPLCAVGTSSHVQSSSVGVVARVQGRRIARGLRNRKQSSCHWDRIGCSLVLACSQYYRASVRWDRLRWGYLFGLGGGDRLQNSASFRSQWW